MTTLVIVIITVLKFLKGFLKFLKGFVNPVIFISFLFIRRLLCILIVTVVFNLGPTIFILFD
jgi:hypothetical protein